MGRNHLSVAVLLMLVVFGSLAPVSLLRLPNSEGDFGDVMIQKSQSSLTSLKEERAVDSVNLTKIIERPLTASDLETLKLTIGVWEEGSDYNQPVNGHGTGLRPPTLEEYASIAANVRAVEKILPTTMTQTPSAVDHTEDPWFPPIGNQDGEGSCVAWAVGYYMKTFQEAKEHGWNVSEATWEGGYYGHPSPSYQDQIISPDFIYHLTNSGRDGGSSFDTAINLVCSVGACTWTKMPYDPNDSTSWPSEEAWREAPLYRGNDTGYEYLSLNSDEGLESLKNWIASDQLAVIAVDGYKYSLLTSDDFWTLDNYVSPNTNHANTIIGYDDNINYTENGQLYYGAFKVANSWGVGSWENVYDGCYWISYEAMKTRVRYCMFYSDMIGYQPELLASFKIEHEKRAECFITIGVGNKTSPLQTKRFNAYINGGNHPFCPNDIVFDITEFREAAFTMSNPSFFLKVYDSGTSEIGTIHKFAVQDTESPDTPLETLNNQYVCATVTLLPCPSLRVIPQTVSLGSGNVIGQDFRVTVVVENEANLYSLDVEFAWNTTYFECISHTVTIPNEAYSSPVPPSFYAGTLHSPTIRVRDEVDLNLGVLWVAYNSTSPAKTFLGNGTIFTMTLRVKDQPSADIDVPLHFGHAVLASNNGTSVMHTVQESKVNIPKLPPDETSPIIFLLSPENKTYGIHNYPLTFIINEQTSWIEYSLDSQANTTISGNTSLTGLPDGTHYVVVYASDTVGNTGASNTIYFGVDTSSPSIENVSQNPASDEVWVTDEVEVNVTVTDNLSGVRQVTLNYTNDNEKWITLTMNHVQTSTWTVTLPSFPSGTKITYMIIAEDNVNNRITTEQLGYEHQYHVIPEFPSFLFLHLLTILTVASLVLHKIHFTRNEYENHKKNSLRIIMLSNESLHPSLFR